MLRADNHTVWYANTWKILFKLKAGLLQQGRDSISFSKRAVEMLNTTQGYLVTLMRPAKPRGRSMQVLYLKENRKNLPSP